MTFATISNDFHNTTTRTRLGRKSEKQMKALKRRLCGVAGCTCSDAIGSRGPQPQTDGRKLLIEWDSMAYVHISLSAE
jgi:hypothetical protein